jgi:cytochrome c oxidase subunit II
MRNKPHFTTRRGFIATSGFGGTALYGLWVAYGAAPGPAALFTGEHAAAHAADAAHDGGRHAAVRMTREEFEARVREFASRFQEADGSVRPRVDEEHGTVEERHALHSHPHAVDAPEHRAREDLGSIANHHAGEHVGHAPAHGLVADEVHDGHGDGGLSDAHDHAASPLDVYLRAAQFHFEPWHLKLEAGRPYRFRMMATDVAHGASIQFGRGGRMIRLRPGQLVETEMTFRRAGEFLIYCTVYCGPAHDAMQGRLSVIQPGGRAA